MGLKPRVLTFFLLTAGGVTVRSPLIHFEVATSVFFSAVAGLATFIRKAIKRSARVDAVSSKQPVEAAAGSTMARGSTGWRNGGLEMAVEAAGVNL